jgi:Leucine-rich repeat (LRR) protein
MGGWQMPMINEIDLSSNSISDSLPILNLPTLKLLQMSHNNIGDISQLNESRLDNLERLILTSNEIKSIPMLRLFHLKYLDLSGNKIQSAQVLKQCRLPMIEKLNLADNLITGIIPALQMPYLTDLTLDRNFISELEFLKERCFTPWIRYISIKQNPKLSSRVDFLVFDETQMDVYSNSFIKRPPDRQKRTFFQD